MSSASNPSPRPVRPSITQVIASALAAVSAAVISSTFGVAGTLIGAGIASVVASVGSTLYLASMRHTNERLRQLAVAARRADWSVTPSSRYRSSSASTTRQGTDLLPAPEPADAQDDQKPSFWSRLRWSELSRGLPTLRTRWRLVTALTVTVFAITIATITAIEAGTNQPVSALVGGGSGSGTSLGHVLGHTSAHSTPAPKPTPAPTAHATPGAAQPSPSAGSSATPQPTSTPSPSPAAPSPSPSASVPAVPSPPAIPSPATVP